MSAYEIELTGEAWRAVGELSADAFADLRQALNRLAEDPAIRGAGYDVTDSGRYTPTLTVGTTLLHYTVDHLRKKVVLHRVVRSKESAA